ncbi:MAG: type 4a pilus biogenesis protein PilO [Pseudomonadota bacterium]
MAERLDAIAKLSTSKKVMILIGILLLLSGAYYYLFYVPMQREVNQLQQKLDQLRVDLMGKQAIVKKLTAFKEEVAKLNEDFTRVLVQLPNKKEIPTLLSNISRLGKDTGLEFLLFKPKSEVVRDFYAEIPIDITVSGSFRKVLTFFHEVGKFPRIVNITNLNMASSPTSGTEVLLTTSCMATTFKFIEREEKSEAKRTKRKKK